MTRKRIIIYGFVILLAAGVFYYRPYLENIYLLSKEKVQDLGINPVASLVQTSQKEISAPPPLRSEKEVTGSVLTRKGVIDLTNVQRKNNGQKILKENSLLDAAAGKKAQDILTKQYFDHVNPDGNGPDYFVSSAGYEYITIGENLALGDFTDDQGLVDAWMGSPGHRENILRPQFQEIGVAAVKGTYEGKSAWVAVQEFGTPLSVCSAVDAGLKKTIDSNSKKISDLQSELQDKQKEIKNTSPRDSAYNELVDSYNTQVNQYNSLIAKTKNLIQNYNSEIQKYNDCVKSY